MAATLSTPVETVATEARAALFPLACNDVGAKEQAEWDGRPLQLNVIVPWKPFVGVKVTLRLPADSLPTRKDDADMEMAKSGFPVTVKAACTEIMLGLVAPIV
jgi:hypothetical protein